MKKVIVLSVVIFVFSASFVFAELVRGINIDFVTIGNAGNAADTGGNPGRGSVNYEYRIGKYEITNAQWNSFVAVAGKPIGNNDTSVNAYNEDAYYTGLQKPTNRISWLEAAQFCNYLTTGDKSKGAYRFSGEFDGNGNSNPGNFLGIDRDSAKARYGTIYVIPTEDEWYKAAYYKPDGSGYSLYANGTSIAPAYYHTNYANKIGQPWDVGSGGIEQNGTFDIMGNVWEWNETAYSSSSSYRMIHGGSFDSADSEVKSSYSGTNSWYMHSIEFNDFGIRVVSIVPEPASLLLLGVGGILLRTRQK